MLVQTPGVSQFFGCRPLGPVAWTVAGGATAAGAALEPAFRQLPVADAARYVEPLRRRLPALSGRAPVTGSSTTH